MGSSLRPAHCVRRHRAGDALGSEVFSCSSLLGRHGKESRDTNSPCLWMETTTSCRPSP
jgi:hypothetical protein